MPRFADDDVLDFMVTEAVVAHAREEAQIAEEKQSKSRQVQDWKDEIKTPTRG